MKTVFERIKNLYGIAKIDTADVLTLAEISAVSGEIMRLNDFLQNIKCATAVNIFTAPSRAGIAKAFENIEYRIDGRKIYISKYDIETVGKIFNAWFGIIFDFYLGGNGKDWNFIDGEKLTWDNIASRDLRWTMAESR
ncbi:hypothetical protein [Eubacterium sp.]|uniref:hypothetical protein n=1 Tax=Eubacterium sp. TaxID=142586 RepID=UPI0025C2506D|nr:hypothetical protein [Eubacterium sp.]